MNGSGLLQALMAVPNPAAGGNTIVLGGGETWEIPIHDQPHVARALKEWRLYRFPSGSLRRQAAQKIVTKAVRLGIVNESLEALKP